MAETKPKTKPKPKTGSKAPSSGGGIKGALTRKLGPLPFWAWAAIAFVGVYYYRHRTASSTAAATTAAPTTSADSGTAGLGDDLGSGSTGGGGGSATPDDGTSTSPLGVSGVLADTVGASQTAASTNLPAAVAGIDITKPTAASDPNFASDAAARSAASIAAGVAPRFGGVTSTQTLGSGVTLTTYATGREVEQSPGKAAYVVSSGSTGTKTAAKVTSTPARIAVPKKITGTEKATKK